MLSFNSTSSLSAPLPEFIPVAVSPGNNYLLQPIYTRLTVYLTRAYLMEREDENPVKLDAAQNRPVTPDALGDLRAPRISGNKLFLSPKMGGPKQLARGGFITSFNIYIYGVNCFKS